jgi:hypothetical protein
MKAAVTLVLMAVIVLPAATNASSVPATRIEARSPAMRAVVSDVLGRIDSSFIRSVTIGPPPLGTIGPKDD